MIEKLKVSLIGCGRLGSAMAKGLLSFDKQFDVVIYDRNPEKLSAIKKLYNGGNLTIASDISAAAKSPIVILLVKPDSLKDTLQQIENELDDDVLIISCAASKTISEIKSYLRKNFATARAMPNTALEKLASYTTFFLNIEDQQKKHVERIEAIFNPLGKAEMLNEESGFQMAGAVLGCSPAYLLKVVKALEEGGIEAGLPAKTALNYAKGALLATYKLLEDDTNPSERIKQIASPGGITQMGLNSLDKDKFEESLKKALQITKTRV